ncbi:MAG: hypothetical protein QNJ68_14710 [Microcoleaceae cyanobacterium MO_207.B10]|nr:hypothetical protein [Microcoleaceae cyanobacterium MO_207.B10]
MNIKKIVRLVCVIALGLTLALSTSAKAQPQHQVTPIASSADVEISSTNVKYIKDLDLLVFEQEVKGTIGETMPTSVGKLDGAPVLGYVFPTTLSPEDVGFSKTEGVVALAVTTHPDFDDTPLWDENNDGNFENDGRIFHTHWVVLAPNSQVAGGLAVKEFQKEDASVVLPPTNPGMPMYMDSPGFQVVANNNSLKVLIPLGRVNGKKDFQFDAVTAYMEVNTSDQNRPMLGVYKVYSVSSGDLSLPYSVAQQ